MLSASSPKVISFIVVFPEILILLLFWLLITILSALFVFPLKLRVKSFVELEPSIELTETKLSLSFSTLPKVTVLSFPPVTSILIFPDEEILLKVKFISWSFVVSGFVFIKISSPVTFVS